MASANEMTILLVSRELLLLFTKKIAYPDDGIDLFLGEPRQQIPPN